ncbi:major facilitator superfamily domain-containing protein [Pelagophyceae sp. CCMP2097]|nr:major facilitator superfamily domain-containing protein [Pelagophyceae sp. CCMP2097]
MSVSGAAAAPAGGGSESPGSTDDDDWHARDAAAPGADERPLTYHRILPVLFLEFLAIAVTRSLLPARLNDFYGDRVYYVIGVAETFKGLLAFGACPFFGRISDVVGRQPCLLVTVVGTTAPCWVLAFTDNLWIYVTALGLSGLCAGTFTLVFAYISDVVAPKERAAAYGLALATLGASFTFGPPLGAFAAERVGEHRVFLVSLFLALADAAFVALALPESNVRAMKIHGGRAGVGSDERWRLVDELAASRRKRGRGAAAGAEARPPNVFDPLDTLQLFRGDPLLGHVAWIVLLYYSGVWALVTTIVIFMVRVFDADAVQIGWLLATYGLSTMVSEGILVRLVVPRLGELNTIRIGLIAFALQCVAIALATSPREIFASIALSLLSNLVYPAVSSLVSRSVAVDEQGEALGAVNGVKAVTEGAGPLAFAMLMSNFESTRFPGVPYLANAVVALLALAVSYRVPTDEEYHRFRIRRDAGLASGHELVGLLDSHADEEEDDDARDRQRRSARGEARPPREARPLGKPPGKARPPGGAKGEAPGVASVEDYQAPLTTAKATFPAWRRD